MTRWEDEFDNNPLHATLGEVRGYLDTKLKEPDSEVELEKRRLVKVLDLLDTALEQVDKETAPIQLLNQINGHLRQPQFWSHLNAYSRAPSAGYLTVVNDHINSLIPTFYQLSNLAPSKKTGKTSKSLEKAFDDFCAAIDAKSKEFDEKLETQDAELTETSESHAALTEEMKQLKIEHEGQLSAWQTEFTKDQTTRAEAFSGDQIQRAKDFAEWLGIFKESSNEKVEALISEYKKNLEEAFQKFEKSITKHQEDAELKHEAILEIHGLVATDGVAGGYNKTATTEQKVANRWRNIAMIALALTAGSVLLRLHLGFDLTEVGGVNWAEAIASISLTGVFLAAAVYASKQSSMHRNNEKQMRWFALEVKAIDPFLSSLPVEVQQKLKAQFSERIFGQNNHSSNSETPDIDPNMMKVMVDTLADAVKSIASPK